MSSTRQKAIETIIKAHKLGVSTAARYADDHEWTWKYTPEDNYVRNRDASTWIPIGATIPYDMWYCEVVEDYRQ